MKTTGSRKACKFMVQLVNKQKKKAPLKRRGRVSQSMASKTTKIVSLTQNADIVTSNQYNLLK